jgi:hypothetical protein
MSFLSFFPATRRETWAQRAERGKAEKEELIRRVAEERLVFEEEPEEVKRRYRFAKINMAVNIPPFLLAGALGMKAAAVAVCAALLIGGILFTRFRATTERVFAITPLLTMLTGLLLGSIVIRPLVEQLWKK